MKFYTASNVSVHFWNDLHHKEIDMRIEPFNVGNHMSGLWKTAVRELARYELDLVTVQVRWYKNGTASTDSDTFFHRKENEKKRQDFSYISGIITADKRAVHLLWVVVCNTNRLLV
jgi:hypothetical protein